jgi:hypothetical protein
VPPVWKLETKASAAAVSAQVLEDFPLTGWKVATGASSCGQGSVYAHSFVAAQGEVKFVPALKPASRGAACSSDTELRQDLPCPVTDGRLDYLRFSDMLEASPTQITLQLAETKTLTRVVARHLSPSGAMPDADGKRPAHKLELLVSTDGTSFTRVKGPLALTPGENGCLDDTGRTLCYLDLPLEASVSARFVRLAMVQDLKPGPSGENLATISNLVELSAWE